MKWMNEKDRQKGHKKTQVNWSQLVVPNGYFSNCYNDNAHSDGDGGAGSEMAVLMVNW